MLLGAPQALSEPTGIPAVPLEQMNCAASPFAGQVMDASVVRAASSDLNKRYDSGKVEIAPSKFRHSSRIEGYYLVYFCRLIINGRELVLANGVPSLSGRYNCHNPGGFGVVYDPVSRSFGKMIFGVNLCFQKR